MRKFSAWFCSMLFCGLFSAANSPAVSYPLVISNRWNGAILAQEQIVSVTVSTQQVASGLSHPVIGLYPADVDGDGAQDLVAAGYMSGRVFWMRNTSGGTVWQTNSVAQTAGKPRAVCAGDLNSDGRKDIAASVTVSDELLWWSNDGAGTNWTANTIDAAFSNAFSIVIQDVDGDTHRDIVATSLESGLVVWWKNANGLGTSWSRQTVASNFTKAIDARCADMNGDGFVDIVGASYGSGEIRWWQNMGGSGLSWTPRTVATGFTQAYSLSPADVDGDGDMDIIACSDTPSLIRVWRNGGAGTNWTAETVASSGFTQARSVWGADLDGDGDTDIAAAGYGANQVAWWEQRETGWVKWTNSTVTAQAITVCCADFTGDGRADIAASGYDQSFFNMWRNDPVYGLGAYAVQSTAVSTNRIQSGKTIVCAVTNSPATSGATQWVCRGWSGAGSIVSGTGTNTGGQVVSAASSIGWNWGLRYYLTVTNDSHGLVNTGSGWYDEGASVMLQAVATTPGYSFASWSGVSAAVATNNPLTVMLTNAQTVKANFGTTGRIITSAAGEHGSVSPSGEVLVAFGGSQSFEITPEPGWRIARVLVNGEESGLSDLVTFSNVREDGTLYVEFERDQVALKVSSPYGLTSPDSGKITYCDGGSTVVCSVLNSPVSVGLYTQYLCSGWVGTGDIPAAGSNAVTPEIVMTEYSTIAWQWKTQVLLRVAYDGAGTSDYSYAWCDTLSEVKVTARAETGYVFQGWSGDVPNGAALDNPITLRMDGTKQLTASFGLYRPTINAAAGNHGTIVPNGYLAVDYLSTPEFAITPDEGYRVESVLIDGVSIGVPDHYQFPPVEADHTIVANFTKATYALTVTSSHGSADPAAGTNVLTAGGVFQCKLSGSPETNSASTQYVCRGWTGSGSVPASGAAFDTGLLLLRNDSAITWNWVTQYWLTVTGAVGGVLSLSNGWYDAGTTQSLQAVSNPGYSFAGWSGDVTGLNTNANPLSLPWSRARALSASFAPQLFTITATNGAGGTIAPAGAVTVAYGQSQTFTNTPSSGYRVTDVTVDGVSAGAVSVYTFTNVISNHTIRAIFLDDVYWLTVASQHGAPDPAKGLSSREAGTMLACAVGGSPETAGTTQYVCTGWIGTGSVVSAGTTTNTDAFAISNDTSITWLWLTNYWLTARANAHGQVSPTGGWHAAGSSNAVVEAHPDSGYKFLGWSGDVPASLTNVNPVTIEMTRAKTIRANFTTNAVSITTRVTGSGTVTPSSTNVAPGSDVSFAIAPLSGSRLVSVLVDSNAVPVTNYYAMTVLLTNVSQDRVISAVFGANTFALTVKSEYGEASPSNGVYVYAAGQPVECSLSGSPSLTNTGRTRRVYTWWTGTGSVPVSGTATNVSITMQHDSAITWNWKTQHLMNVSVSGEGTVNVPTSAWYDATGSVQLTAAPETYNRFVRWSGEVTAEEATNNPVTLSMNMPRDITAVFSADQLDLTVISEHGDPVPPIGIMTYPYGTGITGYLPRGAAPTNAVGTQYVCIGWSGSGAAPSVGSTTNTGAFSLTANSVLTWRWQTNYECSALAAVGGTATVFGRWVAASSTATVTAAALNGYVFAGWTGDVTTSDANRNPLTLTMDAAKTVTAQFATNRPALTVSSGFDVTVPSVGVHSGNYARVQNCTVTSNPVVQGTTRYTCSGWTGMGSVPATGSLASVSVLITNASSITWTWQKQYLLSAAGGINGSVTPTQSWHNSGSTNVTVLALAATGYQFAGWSGDTGFSDTNRNPLTLVMDRARSVYANFVPLRPVFTIANSHGVCVPEPGVYSTHLQGSEIECLVYETPFPSNAVGTQYVCKGWIGSGSVPSTGTGVYVKVTLNTNSSLAWNWTTQYWFSASADGSGTVTPTGGWYDAGSSVTVTPVAAEAHQFLRWTGDVPSPGTTGNVPLAVTMDRARSVQAVFVTNRPVLTVQSDWGTPVPAAGSHTGDYGRAVTCSIDGGPISTGPGTQYVMRGWSGTGCVPSNGAASSVDVTLTNHSSITWNWAKQCRLLVDAEAHGAVTEVSGWYDASSNVTIRAYPDAHYRFTRWTGSSLPEGLSNKAEIVVGMNRAYELHANYDTNPVLITATVEGAANGSMSPTGVIEVLPQGSVTFAITPSNHCEAYITVDGAYVGETNSYAFTNVIEDHTIRAVFSRETLNLRVGSTIQGGRFSPAAGVITVEWGSNVTCQATNSPVTNGLTRYFCSGWTGSGSVSNQGTGAKGGPFTLEMDSEIIWQWDTNYWLDVTTVGKGAVDVTSGWYTGRVTITATPSNHSSFIGWEGDTNGLAMAGNVIVARMDQPRSIQALFRSEECALVIESAWGGAAPGAGTHVYDYGSTITCMITNGPIYQGTLATQIVCVGFTGTVGIGSGIVTQYTFKLTNSETTMVWLWKTNLYLSASASSGGTVTNSAGGGEPVSGWIPAGTNVELWASPQAYYHLSAWTGNLDGVTLESNRASFVMSCPRDLFAQFEAYATSNGVPHWWMAEFGLTNDYETQAHQDTDADGYTTEEEWTAFTDPTNTASRLEVVSIQRTPQQAGIAWTCVSNRLYAVLRTTNLMSAGGFTVVASNLTAVPPTASFTDTNPPPADAMRFYTVEVSLPEE